MTGTTDLRGEHRGVARMLDIMDAIAASIRRGERPSPDDLEQMIDFLRVFVDKCHHTKEEELFFPAIRAATMVDVEDVIVALLAEHEQGREAVSRIAMLAERVTDADESADVELAEAMTGYTRLLRDHISREEQDCFGPADRGLSVVVQEKLVEGYDRIEAEVVGEGVHEGFHALLDRLSREYRV